MITLTARLLYKNIYIQCIAYRCISSFVCMVNYNMYMEIDTQHNNATIFEQFHSNVYFYNLHGFHDIYVLYSFHKT